MVSGLLSMSDGQGIYWEESGSPDGIPLLYLHGGPGAGLGTRGYVTKADPDRFRIIGLDQRGCGRSVPLAADPQHNLEANTTSRLIADLEELRTHCGIDKWVLNGVSWGSTLAMAYAQSHPARILGIVAMAVTTTSRAEIDWITEGVGLSTPRSGTCLPAMPSRRVSVTGAEPHGLWRRTGSSCGIPTGTSAMRRLWHGHAGRTLTFLSGRVAHGVIHDGTTRITVITSSR